MHSFFSRKTLVALTAMLPLLIAVAPVPALAADGTSAEGGKAAPLRKKKLYRWVDANGQVQYSDKIPPEEAKREAEVMDSSVRTRRIKARELTAPEQQAAEEVLELNRELTRRQITKEAHDRSLLVTYSSVAELQEVRDERLANIDQRLVLTQKAVTDSEDALAKTKVGMAATPSPAPGQLKQLAADEKTALDAVKAHTNLRQERVDTEKRFAEDIAQFKALKAASAAAEAGTPR